MDSFVEYGGQEDEWCHLQRSKKRQRCEKLQQNSDDEGDVVQKWQSG